MGQSTTSPTPDSAGVALAQQELRRNLPKARLELQQLSISVQKTIHDIRSELHYRLGETEGQLFTPESDAARALENTLAFTIEQLEAQKISTGLDSNTEMQQVEYLMKQWKLVDTELRGIKQALAGRRELVQQALERVDRAYDLFTRASEAQIKPKQAKWEERNAQWRQLRSDQTIDSLVVTNRVQPAPINQAIASVREQLMSLDLSSLRIEDIRSRYPGFYWEGLAKFRGDPDTARALQVFEEFAKKELRRRTEKLAPDIAEAWSDGIKMKRCLPDASEARTRCLEQLLEITDQKIGFCDRMIDAVPTLEPEGKRLQDILNWLHMERTQLRIMRREIAYNQMIEKIFSPVSHLTRWVKRKFGREGGEQK